MELDCVRVKGKDLPVKIYEPLGPSAQLGAPERAEQAAYAQALTAYRSQDWDAAQAAFEALRQGNPQRTVYQLYLERVAHFVHNPPEADWDGTYTFTTK